MSRQELGSPASGRRLMLSAGRDADVSQHKRGTAVVRSIGRLSQLIDSGWTGVLAGPSARRRPPRHAHSRSAEHLLPRPAEIVVHSRERSVSWPVCCVHLNATPDQPRHHPLAGPSPLKARPSLPEVNSRPALPPLQVAPNADSARTGSRSMWEPIRRRGTRSARLRLDPGACFRITNPVVRGSGLSGTAVRRPASAEPGTIAP